MAQWLTRGAAVVGVMALAGVSYGHRQRPPAATAVPGSVVAARPAVVARPAIAARPADPARPAGAAGTAIDERRGVVVTCTP